MFISVKSLNTAQGPQCIFQMSQESSLRLRLSSSRTEVSPGSRRVTYLRKVQKRTQGLVRYQIIALLFLLLITRFRIRTSIKRLKRVMKNNLELENVKKDRNEK